VARPEDFSEVKGWAVCRWRPTIPGIRQSRCLAHIIAFRPGEQHGDELVAYCGKAPWTCARTPRRWHGSSPR
jgi:hypothetical protein